MQIGYNVSYLIEGFCCRSHTSDCGWSPGRIVFYHYCHSCYSIQVQLSFCTHIVHDPKPTSHIDTLSHIGLCRMPTKSWLRLQVLMLCKDEMVSPANSYEDEHVSLPGAHRATCTHMLHHTVSLLGPAQTLEQQATVLPPGLYIFPTLCILSLALSLYLQNWWSLSQECHCRIFMCFRLKRKRFTETMIYNHD